MPTWLTLVLALGGSAIISTFIGLILTRWFNKFVSKKDAAEAERRLTEDKDTLELAEFRAEKARKEQLVNIEKIIAPINDSLLEIKQKMDNVADGTLCTLRNDILTCYYRCAEKGYRNDYDYQNIHDLYDAYVVLHGNSFVADVMERFDNLPVKEETIAVKVVERKLKEKVTA